MIEARLHDLFQRPLLRLLETRAVVRLAEWASRDLPTGAPAEDHPTPVQTEPEPPTITVERGRPPRPPGC